MRIPSIAALLLLAACSSAGDTALYEHVLWEREPSVQSREDAKAIDTTIAAKSELTLDDCYRLSTHRSEALAISGEELVRLQMAYDQISASNLPYLALKGSYTLQEDVRAFPGSKSSFGLYGRQAIFSGFRDYYAARQSQSLYTAKEHDLRHESLLLFTDVADAFYTILELDRQLTTTQDALKLATERLDELKERNKAGISRRSEVLAQEAEAASTQAEIERLKGAVAVAWEAMQFLTGLADRKKLIDTAPAVPELPAVGEFITKAVSRRNDIRALASRVIAAEETRGIARSGALPTVKLEGDYYANRSDSDISWDLLLSVEVPLFGGGSPGAKMREADSFIRTAGFQLEQLLRGVRLEVNRSYAAVRALQSELVSLEKALASAAENHEIVQAEYRRNIVTNIEVLTAFNTAQVARLQRDRASFQVKLAMIRLAVSTGALPGEDK